MDAASPALATEDADRQHVTLASYSPRVHLLHEATMNTSLPLRTIIVERERHESAA